MIQTNKLSKIVGENQNLKSYSSKNIKFTNDNSIYYQTASQVKMYKRSMFNIACQLSGIESYFSSEYSSNIINIGLTCNSEGLNIGNDANFQIDEFLLPINTQFDSKVITKIFNPYKMLIVSKTISDDIDGETTLVHTDSTIDTYKKTFYNISSQYKVYFPKNSRGGAGNKEVDQEDNMIDVINQSKLYSISISASDKTYTLNATSLT